MDRTEESLRDTRHRFPIPTLVPGRVRTGPPPRTPEAARAVFSSINSTSLPSLFFRFRSVSSSCSSASSVAGSTVTGACGRAAACVRFSSCEGSADMVSVLIPSPPILESEESLPVCSQTAKRNAPA